MGTTHDPNQTTDARGGEPLAPLAHAPDPSSVQDLPDHSTDGFLALDRQWRILYVSYQAELLLGRPREALVGRSAWDAFADALNVVFVRAAVRAVVQRAPVHLEVYYPPSARWFECHLSPSPGELSIYFRDITWRKQAETERERLLADLAAERARLEAVIQQMPTAVVLAEAPSGKLILGNSHLERLWRRPAGESAPAAAEPARYLGFHADNRPYRADEWPLARALATGEVVRGEEIAILQADGNCASLSVSAAPIRDAQQRIVAAVSVFEEISERKRTELALAFLARVGQELASSLDDTTTLANIVRLAVPYLADQCLLALREPGGGLRLAAVEDVNPARAAALRAAWDSEAPASVARVMRTGRPELVVSIEAARLTAQGDEAADFEELLAAGYRSHIIVPLRAQDALLGALSLTMAESRRQYGAVDLALAEELARRAAQALSNARAYAAERAASAEAARTVGRVSRLQSVTAALSGALTAEAVAEVIVSQSLAVLGADAGLVVRRTADGRRLEVLRAVGYAGDLIERWSPAPLDAPCAVAEAARTGEMIVMESQADRARRFPPAIAPDVGYPAGAAVPLLAEDQPIGALGLSFATERSFGADDLALMQALAEQCAQALERARRHAAETQARQEAERQAGRLGELLAELTEVRRQQEDFIHMISHDVRAPLAIVLGYAGMLQRSPDDPGLVKKAADAIVKSTHHINEMIQDLVDSARLESGRLRIERVQVDMRRLVLEVREQFAEAMQAERIRVQVPALAPVLAADPEAVKRILSNLLSNALKYSAPDTPVTLALEQTDDEVIVSVADQGQGVAAEELPHLFTRYYRAQAGRERHDSLGLGLYITKGLVDAHGGRLWVESAVGLGSTFSFALPTG